MEVESLLYLAEQDNVLAQHELGSYFESQKDYYKAVVWFTRAAEQGLSSALNALGICYLNGFGTVKNFEKAFQLFQLAAKQDHTDAQYNLGNCYEIYGSSDWRSDAELSFYWWLKAAEKGHMLAQYQVARCYQQGNKGVSLDKNEAFEWFFCAAKQGHIVSQREVGIFYLNMDNKHLKEAIYWLAGAAEGGDAEAQYQLGRCYEKGIWVDINQPNSFKWYLKAAEQNHIKAQIEVSNCFQSGRGVTLDDKRAFQWAIKAARQGNSEAEHMVGLFYYRGNGIQVDYTEAVRWFSLAANKMFIPAIRNLAVCYELGKGVKMDKAEAASLFLDSALLGSDLGAKRLEEGWSLRQSEKDKEMCTVCLEPVSTCSSKPCEISKCGHVFHVKCIVPWIESNHSCPNCRKHL